MNLSISPSPYGDSPNYAANFAHSASEALLAQLRDYLAKEGHSEDLVAAVDSALAALDGCRGSRRQGHNLPPHPAVLAAIDQAIDAVVLVNVRSNAVVDVGSESRLVELTHARATAGLDPEIGRS